MLAIPGNYSGNKVKPIKNNDLVDAGIIRTVYLVASIPYIF